MDSTEKRAAARRALRIVGETAQRVLTPTFKRGDLVTYTDRQGVTLETRVRRVESIRGTRYYALDGVGVMVADGLEERA